MKFHKRLPSSSAEEEGMRAAPCRICGDLEPNTDLVWEAIAGDTPGPRTMALGHYRHAMVPLHEFGFGMHDDAGNLRCIYCLHVVRTDPVEGLPAVGTRVRLPHWPMLTGYELLCCGGDGV